MRRKNVNTDPYKEYIRQSEPGKREKGYAWHTAIGLQAVDGLKTSEYLRQTAERSIEGEISFEEADALLQSYYEENPARDAENAWYFRNALVRANYSDLRNGIHETTEYLELFLRDLLLGEHHPLHNRTLHISGAFKEGGKPDIEEKKPDIGIGKPDIERGFRPRTLGHIRKLREFFPGKTFGRQDVMAATKLGPSRASELLKDMLEKGVIEPVTGQGKGKYRFRIASL